MIKKGNVVVSPNFDSGDYTGTFNICDADENETNFRYPAKLTIEDFDNLSLLIAIVVDDYINMKDRED